MSCQKNVKGRKQKITRQTRRSISLINELNDLREMSGGDNGRVVIANYQSSLNNGLTEQTLSCAH